jgi:hypothetical protein
MLIKLIVKPEGDGPPVEHRVRRLLKYALRSCRLRCVDMAEEPDPVEKRTSARAVQTPRKAQPAPQRTFLNRQAPY